MSELLTKEEREKLADGVVNGWAFSDEDMALALDTIDALEAQRDTMIWQHDWGRGVEAHTFSELSIAMEASDALRDMISNIKTIALANHDTKIIGDAHRTLKRIVAMIISGNSDTDHNRSTCDRWDCDICGALNCPRNERLHWHHDGCPSCAFEEGELEERLTPPWNELDDGIRPIVRALFYAGLQPFASCQGGNGHIADKPFVNIASNPDEFEAIASRASNVLIEAGYEGFHVARITNHQRDSTPWPEWPSYVCIELWSEVDGDEGALEGE